MDKVKNFGPKIGRKFVLDCARQYPIAARCVAGAFARKGSPSLVRGF